MSTKIVPATPYSRYETPIFRSSGKESTYMLVVVDMEVLEVLEIETARMPKLGEQCGNNRRTIYSYSMDKGAKRQTKGSRNLALI